MKVLQLSTYPIKKPRHGGQIRVSQIKNKLVSLGHEVKNISFSEVSHMYFDEKDDYIVDNADLSKHIKTMYSTDLATALHCKKDNKCQQVLVNVLSDFKPDVIFIEQSWLWPAIKEIQKKHSELINSVVYSSHNVEFMTKKSLFESNGVNDMDDVINKIKEIEEDLICNAAKVITCTEDDAEVFSSMGAKDIIVCPNGVAPLLNNEKVDEIKFALEAKLGNKKYALFVGSAYPPNAQGFWDNLGNSMSWLGLDEFIFSVGGCSNILESFMPQDGEICTFLNFDKIRRLGQVSDEELSALIQLASVIILPISDGGGSNLKTAEAIASLRPVVATETACRGFENVKSYTNFYVCSEQTDFKRKIKDCLENESEQHICANEKAIREKVYWSHTLDKLEQVF